MCDLDGVVWLSHDPIPGSVEAITALRAAGHRVTFVTNNGGSLVETHEQALAKIGLPSVGDVLTSSGAAATLLKSGQRILVAGGPGIVEAVERVGAVVVGRTDDDMDDASAIKTDVDIDAGLGFSRSARNECRGGCEQASRKERFKCHDELHTIVTAPRPRVP